ncbi:hypothetical protein [Isoptericola variabilis]|uniref:Uncharacterized protein n=1 Tax=Isoptericola variabilis (strain 225) TaxID=743718 RepID=F6FT49_ISOV2|nr:hypothetical protein [Isoptericola variabilis]AEG44120.1 hypothetical protein Isova_1352 [Isoptericola variabilis 225]TWH27091.1 hypothetical protein L600_005500000040 [Isoptericola variabilis J7]
MSLDAGTGGTAREPLAPLEGLDGLPVHDHVSRFEAVHGALVARLEGADGSATGEAEA